MNADRINVSAANMRRLLARLAGFTAEPTGVTRLLYTREWLEAQAYVAEQMDQLGFQVRSDRVGNVFGRLEGASGEAAVVLTGSHIDTVRAGGKYDGAYGIAAGIAALDYLRNCYGAPVRTLEVASFCEEEGSRFPFAYWGSGNVTGVCDWREADRYADADGVTLREAMEAVGFGRASQADCVRRDLAAFVELHIEQGVMLERTRHDIGIVRAIVGQRRYRVMVRGEANHAGTTPMSMRKDALACAAEMILRVEALALGEGEPLVATVGRLEPVPNTPNVVPGSAVFTLDVRHADGPALDRFCLAVLESIADIALRRGLTAEASRHLGVEPTPLYEPFQEEMEHICCRRQLSFLRMVSGAGHDAQLLQAVCPSALIFVPSRGGISHSPDEYTPPDALDKGLLVLTELLYKLAYEERLP